MQRETVYKSLREELLEQRRHQLQMYTLSAGALPPALLFAEKANLGTFMSPACILISVAALMMVFYQERSIVQKVGYLRVLEENEQIQKWCWESDKDAFLKNETFFKSATVSRHHSYVAMISLFINTLIWVSVFLYAIQPFPVEYPQRLEWLKGGLGLFCLLTGFYCTIMTYRSLYGFILGSNSVSAIYDKWHYILSKRYLNLRPKCDD